MRRKPPEKGTDRAEARGRSGVQRLQGELGDRLGIKRPEELRTLALGWVRSEGLQSRPRLEEAGAQVVPACLTGCGTLKLVSVTQPLITYVFLFYLLSEPPCSCLSK